MLKNAIKTFLFVLRCWAEDAFRRPPKDTVTAEGCVVDDETGQKVEGTFYYFEPIKGQGVVYFVDSGGQLKIVDFDESTVRDVTEAERARFVQRCP